MSKSQAFLFFSVLSSAFAGTAHAAEGGEASGGPGAVKIMLIGLVTLAVAQFLQYIAGNHAGRQDKSGEVKYGMLDSISKDSAFREGYRDRQISSSLLDRAK